MDKWGYRICLLAFACFICAGQVVLAIGVSSKSWPLMYIGRVLFGIGGESLGVGNSALLSEWFKGKELAFAFGLNLSIARLGSVINNLVSPAIAANINIQFAFWFGSILCGASVMCVLAISSIDRQVEASVGTGDSATLLLNEDIEEDTSKNTRNPSVDVNEPLAKRSMSADLVGMTATELPASANAGEDSAVSLWDVFTLPQGFWILVVSCVVVYGCVLPFNNIASSLLLERNFFIANPSDCTLTNPFMCENTDAGSPNYNPPVAACPSSSYYQPPLPTNVTINGVTYLPLTGDDIDCESSSWSNSGTCGYTYCTRLTDGERQAATIMSIPYIISACLSPVLGGIVDRVGLRAVVATIAPAVLVIVHLFLGTSNVNPVGPLVGQGLAYSGFAAVLWPSVPLVVPEKYIGFGFGIVTAIQNAGLASFPPIISTIYSAANDHYIPKVEYFFVSLASLGVLVGLYLNYYDFTHGSVLNGFGKSAKVAGISNTNSSGNQEEGGNVANPFAFQDANSLNGNFSSEDRVKMFAAKDVRAVN